MQPGGHWMKYMKTEEGQRAFKERAPALSSKLRAAFILVDGKRTAQDVVRATAGLGISEVDIAQLETLGFIAPSPHIPDTPATSSASKAAPQATSPADDTSPATGEPAPGTHAAQTLPQELYMRAYPIATQLTASLGLRGFRLNLAVESAGGYQQLVELVPRIREAVGAAKCRPLEDALGL
jgi:hypothetical protein